jgi:hypothetical protein
MMEIEKLCQHLLAKMETDKEEMKANRKTDKEDFMARMDANMKAWGETPLERGVPCITQIRHTAPFLRLFVLNRLTVHPGSFSLKTAAASFCPATPCSDYSPAVTSSSVACLGMSRD